MNISAPFIRRPIATSLLAAAILLAGLAAYLLLPVSPLPRVDFPTISVSASLPGANPETMASSVATPLERRFGRIAGVTEITSISSLASVSIVLQFDLNRNVEAAARDVQAAIAAAGGELPPSLPSRPTYRKVNPSDSSILMVSLASGTVPLGQVYDQANTIFAEKISQVPGVGQVFVGGGQQPAVRVQVDPVALSGVGLSLEDVRQVLSTSTSNQPKGALVGNTSARTISANDQLFHAEDYKPLVLAYRNGTTIRLSDVANVFDDVENERVAGWVDGKRGIILVIRRQPGANIIETIERIKALLPSLESSISPSIKVEVALDRAGTIRASVHDVEWTLIISVVLVTIVVFVFLRSLRATAIPSIVVPLSLVGTFCIMYLLRYSLDNLSLMALTVSTGFVVDDAIVVTENISRFIEQGDSPTEAALKGAKQIGFTIVSITCSLLAVFIPILLMGGIVGRLFREFAVTLSVAIGFSAVVSLTLTPMMCSRLLRPVHGPRSRLYEASERMFESALRFYDRGLCSVIRHQHIMQVATVLAVVLTVALAYVIPKGLFPQQDTGVITGFSDAPQDVSFPSMRDRQMALNDVVVRDPDVDHFISFIGSSSRGTAGNTGTMFMGLKPRPGRTATADEVIARLRKKLSKVEGVSLFLQCVQDVRVGGRTGRTQYQYTLEDANLEELEHWAPKILARLKQIPELKDVNTDQQTSGLRLDVAIDRDTASRLGISPKAIDDTLYDAYGQRQVATDFTDVNQYRVVLEVKPEFLQNVDALGSLYVKSGQSSVAGTALGGAASGPVGTVGGSAALPSSTTQPGATALPATAGGAMVPDVPNARLGASGIASQVGIVNDTTTVLQASSGLASNATPLTSQAPLAEQPVAVSTVSSNAATGAPPANMLVPLGAVTKLSSSNTSLSINHQGQFPAVTLAFNLAPGKSLGEAIPIIHKAERDLGVPESVRANFQGTAQAFTSSLASEPLLIVAAIFTVYIVLGVLYESYIHPITILSTLPPAGVGALLALLICRTEFSVIALIGIVLLIGIVKKNAIMMIDFALEAERDQGIPREEAIHQACLLRFRPIMMTTLAALLGGLPLALGTGTGSELRQPLGITIVGGLIVSQMLTLYSTPVIYLALDRLSGKRRRPVRVAKETDLQSLTGPLVP